MCLQSYLPYIIVLTDQETWYSELKYNVCLVTGSLILLLQVLFQKKVFIKYIE